MPSLRQIRYFLAVADLGSFTQAATALYIAQPALSRQIAQLESELGFDLFAREARGVRLTAAGRLFHDRVAPIEQQLAAAAEEGGRLARGEGGVLRLLHSSSIPVAALMSSLRDFAAAAPGARIDLDRVSSEAQIGELAGGQADVGIVRLPLLKRDPAVALHALPPDRLWAALPPRHPFAKRRRLTLADLAGEAFVSAVHRERGGLARRVTDLCLLRGFVPRLAPVISRKTSMLDLVAAGFGVAVVPGAMTKLGGSAVVYKPLADEDASAEWAVALPPAPTPLARRFADLFLQQAGG